MLFLRFVFGAGSLFLLFLVSGCTQNQHHEIPEESENISRSDLTTETITSSDGELIVLPASQLNAVKSKKATIRSSQQFDKVEDSTFTIESGVTTISQVVKSSTIIVQGKGVFIAPYIKNSKIIIKDEGDLQVSNRLKNTEVLIEGGTFSVQPVDIDDFSKITQK